MFTYGRREEVDGVAKPDVTLFSIVFSCTYVVRIVPQSALRKVSKLDIKDLLKVLLASYSCPSFHP